MANFLLKAKDKEFPEVCASVTLVSFPKNPVVGSGTYGNCPVGPEILSFHAKKSVHKNSQNRVAFVFLALLTTFQWKLTWTLFIRSYKY